MNNELKTAIDNLLNQADAIEMAKPIDLVAITNSPGGLNQTRQFIIRHLATHPVPDIDPDRIADLLSIDQPFGRLPDNIRKCAFAMSRPAVTTKATEKLTNAPSIKLDYLDNKIIELYQEVERRYNENEIAVLKYPSADKIADIAHCTHLTNRKLSNEAINKRIRKLKENGLVGTEKRREQIQSPEQISDKTASHKLTF